ncbi:KGK family protein [Crinalium epipsammum PCC 9333]|uniref:KGK family protein n=1 Tax=Crinalium epipsammum PCC 9333 TaxID=1173022 RepID=K9W1Y6_9CYAN|nr:KGK domain-containing protein [Crinalium epipsammum]AFZ13814.1 KGK family protein [Crinalium epipsammum PCC 9333]
MNNQFRPLDSESEENDIAVLFSETGSIFKVGQLISAFNEVLKDQALYTLRQILGSKGIIPDDVFERACDCEILKPGSKGWKKGRVKIRISLEFCPDEPEDTETPENNQPETNEPESPLDDLRRMINEQT